MSEIWSISYSYGIGLKWDKKSLMKNVMTVSYDNSSFERNLEDLRKFVREWAKRNHWDPALKALQDIVDFITLEDLKNCCGRLRVGEATICLEPFANGVCFDGEQSER